MSIIMPGWAQSGYRTVRDMYSLPAGCEPHRTYLCFRSEARQDGGPERRCKMLLDFWGADGRWHSPQLGTGIYRGLCQIPGEGPWLLSQYSLPEPDALSLVFVPDSTHAVHHPVLRGLYLGTCEQDGDRHGWRVQLDWLGRNVPSDRRAARILDNGKLLWLPLPYSQQD
jgi:hypothetical protein